MEIVKMTNEYYSDVYELWLTCRGMGRIAEVKVTNK